MAVGTEIGMHSTHVGWVGVMSTVGSEERGKRVVSSGGTVGELCVRRLARMRGRGPVPHTTPVSA
eukprot:scaffold31284_cov66-Phaeocystis_antarctica.AAC.1